MTAPQPHTAEHPQQAPAPQHPDNTTPVPKSLDEVPEEVAMQAIPMLAPDIEVTVDQKRQELLLRRTFPLPKGFWPRLMYWLGQQPQIRTRLDPGGASFWVQVDGKRTLGEIADIIAERYNASPQQARDVTLAFTRSLMLRRFLLLWMPGDSPPEGAISHTEQSAADEAGTSTEAQVSDWDVDHSGTAAEPANSAAVEGEEPWQTEPTAPAPEQSSTSPPRAELADQAAPEQPSNAPTAAAAAVPSGHSPHPG